MGNEKKPRIRFPEFADDWERCKLIDVAVISKGTQINKSELKGNGKYYVLNGGMSPSGYTDEYNTPKGTISISEGGNSCGYVAYNDECFWSGGHNYTLSQLKVDTKFLYQNLKAQETTIMALRVGSGLPNIQKSALSEIDITYPKREEQLHIGEMLFNLDNLINLHLRKIECAKIFKNSMLKKMFPKEGELIPEVRFPEFTNSWERSKFSELVTIERGGSPRPIDKFITKDEKGLNWVKISDAPKQGNYITQTADKIIPEGLSKTREVHPGDLILSNSMSFGKPYIMAIDGCIHDGWLAIRDTQKNFDLKYLCILLGTESMLSQYKSMAAGSTVNNLNKELVGSTTVLYPSMDEQIKIGQYFDGIDILIGLHQRKCDELINLKRFLLRNMFV